MKYTQDIINTKYLVKAEEDPHITIKYGIETTDVEEVKKALGNFIPIRVMFGATKMFMASDTRPTDVVFIETFGESMRRLRQRVEKNLKTEEPFIYYSPHMTLAFVNEHSAMQYVGSNPLIGRKFVAEELVFVPAEGDEHIIKCGGVE